jgi:hypothetical protein
MELLRNPGWAAPAFRIALAEAERARLHPQFPVAERAEHGFVEASGRFEIAHRDGDVIDHERICDHLTPWRRT